MRWLRFSDYGILALYSVRSITILMVPHPLPYPTWDINLEKVMITPFAYGMSCCNSKVEGNICAATHPLTKRYIYGWLGNRVKSGFGGGGHMALGKLCAHCGDTLHTSPIPCTKATASSSSRDWEQWVSGLQRSNPFNSKSSNPFHMLTLITSINYTTMFSADKHESLSKCTIYGLSISMSRV